MKDPSKSPMGIMMMAMFDRNIHSIEDAKKFARPIEEWDPEEIRDVVEGMFGDNNVTKST